MVWEPIVSRQLAVLGTQIVWATKEDNGVAEYRWSLWLGGRRFTIRHRGKDDAYTGVPDGDIPWVATCVDPHSFRVEFPFYPGPRQLTFHPDLMTVVVTDRPAAERPSSVASVVHLEPEEPASSIWNERFSLEADPAQAEDAAILQGLAQRARSRGEICVGRWTVRMTDPEHPVAPEQIALVVARTIGDPLVDLSPLSRPVHATILDALVFLTPMDGDQAADLAGWFFEGFSPNAHFYEGTASTEMCIDVIVGIEGTRVEAITIITPWMG
ncbi:MAG: hypothetical protein H0T42_15725 [Deltaproteobacteria bacterium]|nr:hypothetical protein [Deltaproteobacteria bacterium]